LTDDTHNANYSCDLITLDSIQDILIEEEPIEDVVMITQRLLKQATCLNTHATLKSIIILTAIISYMKLYHKWKNTGAQKQKQPAKAASTTVTACMGKGSTFARQIHEMVPYICQHHRLPDCKKYSWPASGSLLDNEAVIAGIQRHLAEQKLGEVSSHH